MVLDPVALDTVVEINDALLLALVLLAVGLLAVVFVSSLVLDTAIFDSVVEVIEVLLLADVMLAVVLVRRLGLDSALLDPALLDTVAAVNDVMLLAPSINQTPVPRPSHPPPRHPTSWYFQRAAPGGPDNSRRPYVSFQGRFLTAPRPVEGPRRPKTAQNLPS